MTPSEYRGHEQDLREVLGICNPFLSQEAVADVEHRLDHAEIEMAFESLCLSIRGEGVIIPEGVKAVLLHLGPALGVDKASALEENFWGNMLLFLDPSTKIN